MGGSSVDSKLKAALVPPARAVAKRMPSSVKAVLPHRAKNRILDGLQLRATEPPEHFEYLQNLMNDRYHVNNLATVDRHEFKEAIDAFLALENATMEGYTSAEGQRIKTVKFVWPYDHDFGDFQVGPGKGKYRPAQLITRFMDEFGVPSKDLTGKRILDIGCYLGGPSILLAAMGADVVAIEEVKKYVDCLLYLRDAFAIDNLHPRNLSLWDLAGHEYQDAFDIVLFAGVLYHLSDPVLGMRLIFNAVRPGGTVLLETSTARSQERILVYAGKNEWAGKNVSGTNWFIPSPLVVTEMMDEVGFTNIHTAVRTRPSKRHDRMVAIGTKVKQVDMLRAGLSVPTVR
jgi:2-polyprenyl-3-methyl-5-hydroxy-6-metoxy-1,4-benzoquinol methylase